MKNEIEKQIMAKNKDIQSMALSPDVEDIRSRIYIVRGVPVMFDFDLARYYGIETRVLKQAVRRNMDSFPEDFMFILTQKEANTLIYSGSSQIVTPPNYNLGLSSPYVFTEAGVAMLSAVLKSSVAVNTRVQVMRGFVAMHQYLSQNGALMYRMDKLELTQQEQAEQLKMVMSGVDTILTELENRRDTSRPAPIGYEATAERYKKENERGKKQ